MTRQTLALLAALCLALTSTATAQSRASHPPVWPDEGPMTWPPRPTETGITANDLRTRLYQIADDSMQGRRIGEIGNAKVTDYIAREFARLGLRPAGENGTWFQSLPYGAFGVDVTTARLTIGGSALDLRREWLPTAPSAITGLAANVDLRNVPVVFAGRWEDTLPLTAAVKGRIAVFVSDAAGTAGARAVPPSFVSCADVPDKFGADAVIAFEAAQRAQAQNRPPPRAPPRR